jgi:uncharacterized protein (TIGR02246 family)
MSNRSWLAATLGVALAVFPGIQTAVAQQPGKEGSGSGKRAQAFIAAFNKGDAKAVAAFWTPDGDYTDMAGEKYKGRAALEKLYGKVFAENKGAKLTIHVGAVRAIGTDTAIEEGITEVVPAEGGLPSVAAFMAVLVKRDGDWYFESVHDSVARPPSNAAHFEDLEWLLGNWVGEETKGESSRASYNWAENRNFIVSSFATTVDGIPVVGGTQWIGWDAIDKQIRSYSFYSGGGIGEATWTKSDGKWLVKTTAKTSGGKKLTAVNVVTMVDADHATWQLTQLHVDGTPLPDPPLIKLKRVK